MRDHSLVYGLSLQVSLPAVLVLRDILYPGKVEIRGRASFIMLHYVLYEKGDYLGAYPFHISFLTLGERSWISGASMSNTAL